MANDRIYLLVPLKSFCALEFWWCCYLRSDEFHLLGKQYNTNYCEVFFLISERSCQCLAFQYFRRFGAYRTACTQSCWRVHWRCHFWVQADPSRYSGLIFRVIGTTLTISPHFKFSVSSGLVSLVDWIEVYSMLDQIHFAIQWKQ